jgi:hypothetical protein
MDSFCGASASKRDFFSWVTLAACLTSSCRRHEMDPQLYIDAWLPDRWKQAQLPGAKLCKYPSRFLKTD